MTSYVYMLANEYNTTLYIGVTSDLIKRLYEHQNKLVDGFTKKYNLHKLVYFEEFENIKEAIQREKYLKGKKRSYKDNLIKSVNPKWEDLGLKYNIVMLSETNHFNSHCHSEQSEESQELKSERQTTKTVMLSETNHFNNHCHSEQSEESHEFKRQRQTTKTIMLSDREISQKCESENERYCDSSDIRPQNDENINTETEQLDVQSAEIIAEIKELV